MILNDFLYYTTLILIYDVLYSFRLYYIQFKEFKILWGPGTEDRMWERGAGDRIWGPEVGGWITQRPFRNTCLGNTVIIFVIKQVRGT